MTRSTQLDITPYLAAAAATERDQSVLDAEFGRWLHRLVTAATRGEAGAAVQSLVPCFRKPRGRACRGRLELWRQEVPPRIMWRCPVCGDARTVVGWRHSGWDLTPHPGSDRADERMVVTLSLDQFHVVEALAPVGSPGQLLVWSAQLAADLERVELVGRWEELESLLVAVAEQASQAGRVGQRVMLDHLIEAIGQALVDQQP